MSTGFLRLRRLLIGIWVMLTVVGYFCLPSMADENQLNNKAELGSFYLAGTNDKPQDENGSPNASYMDSIGVDVIPFDEQLTTSGILYPEDFFVLLHPIQYDLPALMMGKTGNGLLTISEEFNRIMDVEFHFWKQADGKYYFQYNHEKGMFPRISDGQNKVVFEPNAPDKILIRVKTNEFFESCLVGANIKVYNETDIPVVVKPEVQSCAKIKVEMVRGIGIIEGTSTQFKTWENTSPLVGASVDYGLLQALLGDVPGVISPDGNYTATAHGRTVELYQIGDNVPLKLEGHDDQVVSLQFNKDGNILASGSKDGIIKLWSTADGTLLRTLNQEVSLYSSGLTFGGKNKEILIAQSYNKVNLWQVDNGALLASSPASNTNYVCLSSDGNKLTISDAYGVDLWDVDAGVLTYTLDTIMAYGQCFSPDGNKLAGMQSTKVKVWNTNTGMLENAFDNVASSSYGRRLVFSPDGKFLAANSDSDVKVFNLDTLSATSLPGTYNRAMAFSPDSSIFAANSFSSNTDRVILWRTNDYSPITTLNGISATIIKFDSSGLMAIGVGGETKVYNTADFSIRQTLQGLCDQLHFISNGELIHTVGSATYSNMYDSRVWSTNYQNVTGTLSAKIEYPYNDASFVRDTYVPLVCEAHGDYSISQAYIYIDEILERIIAGNSNNFKYCGRILTSFMEPGTHTIKFVVEDSNGNTSTSTKNFLVRAVVLSSTDLSLHPGEAAAQIQIAVPPDNDGIDRITWVNPPFFNTQVATYSINGDTVTFTPIGPGNTVFYGTLDESGFESCFIEVTNPVTGVTLDNDSLEIKTGDAPATLNATLTPTNATNKLVYWVSSDPQVVSVDGNGLIASVCGVGAGNATVKAVTDDGGLEASCAVKVIDGIPPKVESTDPVNGELGVALDKTITICFDEPIKLVGDPYTNSKIEVINSANGKPAAFNAVVNDEELLLTRKNGGSWNSNTQYTVQIHSGAVQDIAGNNYAEEAQFSFTTLFVPAEAEFTFSPVEPVANQTIKFNASKSTGGSGSITAYNWNFGDGSIASGITASHIYENFGEFTVTLTIDLADGSSKVANQVISIIKPQATLVEVPGTQQGTVINGVNPTTIKADKVRILGNGVTEYSGNVSINQYLKLDGTLTVDEVNLEMTGSGCLYVEAAQGNLHGQIDLFKGDFTLNGETGELLKQMGLDKLQIAGLNVEISSLRLLSNGVKVAGKLELPDNVGGLKVDIDNLQVVNGQVDYEGRIDLPTLKLAKSSLGLNNAYMEFDSVKKKFVGHAILEIPYVCDVEGKIGLINASLDEVGFGLDGKSISIDATGFFINRLYGGVSGLTKPPLKITGQSDISGGPKIYDVVAIEGKDLTITVDMSGAFSGSGEMKLFSFKLADGEFELDKDKGFHVAATLEALDIVEANLDLNIDKSLHLQGSAQGNISVPDGVPWIGGWEVSDTAMSINDVGINADIEVGSMAKVGFWIKWDGQFGVSGRITCFDSKNLINNTVQRNNIMEASSLDVQREEDTTDSPLRPDYIVDGELEETGVLDNELVSPEDSTIEQYAEFQSELIGPTTIEMPDGQSLGAIRLTWEGEGETDLSLTDPDGASYTPENSGLDSLSANYFNNSNQKEAYYIIANPVAGTWEYSLSNTSITTYTVAVYQIEAKPSLQITDPGQDVIAGDVQTINWCSNALTGNVSLYYSAFNQQTTGTLIASDLDIADSSYGWDTANMHNGDYYIYGVLNDGTDDPVIAWAPGKVTIENPQAPRTPQGLNVEGINGSLLISWEPSSDEDLESYLIQLVNDNNQVTDLIPVPSDRTSYELSGLDYDQTYGIAMAAIDTGGLKSSLTPVVSTYLPQPVPPTVNLTWPAEVTSQFQVAVSGYIGDGATGVLYLNNIEYANDLSENFNQSIDLVYGSNHIKLIATKPNGDTAEAAFQCYYDPTPPQLTVENLSPEMEVATSVLEVSGTVEPAAVLTLNDIPILVDSDGTFETTMNLETGYNHLFLAASDEAGNQTVFNSLVLFQGIPVIYGDVNSDSSVNITDAVLVLKYITNPTIQIDLTAADVNGDSTTNITDAVLILKHITNPTVPFPVEG